MYRRGCICCGRGILCFLNEVQGAFVKAKEQLGIGEGILHALIERIHDGGIHATGECHGEEGCIDAWAAGEAEGNIARPHDAGEAEFLFVQLDGTQGLARAFVSGADGEDERVKEKVFFAESGSEGFFLEIANDADAFFSGLRQISLFDRKEQESGAVGLGKMEHRV